MSKKNRIETIFHNRRPDQKIMSLFVTAGYPEVEKTPELVVELTKSGADIIELGMPFSDPLADGPTIQFANKTAIDQGVNIESIFEMVRRIREKSEVPVVLMGYINPVLKFGLNSFFSRAAECGVDGVIIPDAPPGELPELDELAAGNGIATIYLVAPNTPDERMKEIDKRSSGFVYCVSVAGVTGARKGAEVSRSVTSFIQRVTSNVTKNPVLIGFGISSHEDAVQISKEVDGFIVGSALIDKIREEYPASDWIQKTADFVKVLKIGEHQKQVM
ncbi:tryptophan synthase subunit alpha [Natronogracilivirga saccharolytica]|uniref:Tryptophan synthase alpha chain n=1 Tax=Natronogracilivirga saccharolytica TaxID=2812953 RepID=A0A8J7UTA5_9BACT|nr:tryptophan synthase subunit alpha [Natronogracilivirga saccharolytica]MBP3192411.1 tryptophan synthase subunit alpha [Natronogracilivirga saccharolytica]